MSWTLEYDSVEQSFAEWGMVRVRREVDSQGPDMFAFDVEGVLMDADADIPDGGEIIVRKDDVVWFIGRRITNPRTGSPELERLSYIFAGPWWYLERMIFQQTWKSSDAYAAISEVTISRLFLQQTITGTKQTTAAQIAEVITWVRARMLAQYGAYKLQTGSGFPAIDAPIDEVNDITCAEVIRKCMRWAPDSVLWFDYSTSPPTLNCKKRADLSASSVALADGTSHESINITSRDDLLVPSVHFKYRQTSQIDGASYVRTFDDLAPGGATGLEFGALVATFDFDGGSLTTAQATIVTETIAASTLAWWQAREAKLQNKNLANVSLISGSDETSPTDSNTKELTSGQIADWMSVPVSDKTMKVKASADLYDQDVSGGIGSAKKLGRFTLELSHQCKATTAASGTYSTTLSSSSAEAIPSGLAAQVYASLSTLQWQGSISIIEDEVTGTIGVGKKLNVTSGRTEWASMDALIQSVTYDLDTGRTTLNFGPAPFLGAGDLIDLLRVGRTRLIRTPFSSRTAAGGSNSQVTLGDKLTKGNNSPLTTVASLQRLIPDVTSPTGATQFIESSCVSNDLQHQLQGSTTRLALRNVTATAVSDELKTGAALFAKRTVDATSIVDEITTASGKKWKVTVDASHAQAEVSVGNDSILIREDKIEIVRSGGASVKIDLADANGKAISLREIDVCESGVAKHMMILGSATYT